MSEYFNLPGFNNDLLDTAHSVLGAAGTLGTAGTLIQAGKAGTLGTLDPYNWYFLLLAVIADVQGGSFDIDFTSYIKAHTHLL